MTGLSIEAIGMRNFTKLRLWELLDMVFPLLFSRRKTVILLESLYGLRSLRCTP